MNYEELLAAKNRGRLNPSRQPIGEYYRTQVDGKYRGVVDIAPQLHSSIVFSGALRTECEHNVKLISNHQLHFQPIGDGPDIRQLEVEPGVYLSFEQLLQDNPAVVASNDFIGDTLRALVEVTNYLHAQGIRHVCYSPRTVFVRKGDNGVMLLSHGSFYLGIDDQRLFYGDDAAYVAPEVLNHGAVDNRCDVYSIGKFLEYLFAHSSMPIEYRKAVKRATSESPEDRFDSLDDLLRAVQRRRSALHSVVTLAIAAVVALFCVGIYFDLFPESHEVEFVKPAPRQQIDDLIDDGFDPAELGVTNADTVGQIDTSVQADYQAKAEAIFRKRYAAEAERILSNIYNKENMSNSEKQFRAANQATLEELMKQQQALGEEAGLTMERSQLIATEIIDRISEKMKREMGGTNSHGIQK